MFFYFFLWQKVFVAKGIAQSVAYLGFREGGAKFLLATSAHTKEGATKIPNFFMRGQPRFPFFFNVNKKFWPKGGHGPMPPPLNTPLSPIPLKYATDDDDNDNNIMFVEINNFRIRQLARSMMSTKRVSIQYYPMNHSFTYYNTTTGSAVLNR